MMGKTTPLFTLLLLTLTISSSPLGAQEEPLKVNIIITAVAIGPSRFDGNPWDKSNNTPDTPPTNTTASDSKVDTRPELAIQALLETAPAGRAAPDVVGYVVQAGATRTELAAYAGIPLALASTDNLIPNSYTPRFRTGYSGWPLYAQSRLRIRLWDRDRRVHQHIGMVEINYEHILDALKAGVPTWINVAEQSNNQLLYVQLSVSKAAEHARPRMYGYRFSW